MAHIKMRKYLRSWNLRNWMNTSTQKLVHVTLQVTCARLLRAFHSLSIALELELAIYSHIFFGTPKHSRVVPKLIHPRPLPKSPWAC